MRTKHVILIVGLGRLGSRTAAQLAKENDLHLTLVLCDYDIVLEDNLAEQPLYTKEDVGLLKVEAAKKHLQKINPTLDITTIARPFTEEHAHNVRIILDGTDNLATRIQLNRTARRQNIPLIIAAASEKAGMVFPVLFAQEFPCWECVVAGKQSDANCDEGINNALADRVAQEQVTLCRRILFQERTSSELSILDNDSTRQVVVRKNPLCWCAQQHAPGKDTTILSKTFTLEPCVSGRRLIARLTSTQHIDIKKIKNSYMIQQEYPQALLIDLLIGTALVHKHGVIEFNGVSKEIAQKFVEDVIQNN